MPARQGRGKTGLGQNVGESTKLPAEDTLLHRVGLGGSALFRHIGGDPPLSRSPGAVVMRLNRAFGIDGRHPYPMSSSHRSK